MPDFLTNQVARWPCQLFPASTTIAGEVGGNLTLAGGDNVSSKQDTGPLGILPLGIHLNGSDDYATLGAGSVGGFDGFFDADPQSLALWVKVDTSHTGTFFAKAGATQANRTLQVYTSTTDALRYNILSRGTITSFNRTLAFAQAWHHIGATSDGAGNGVFYIDGVSAGAFTIGSASIETQNILVGARTESSPASPFDGLWCDLRLYARALSAADMLALYRHTFNAKMLIGGNKLNLRSKVA